MWSVLSKFWEWLVGVAVIVLGVLYFIAGRDSSSAFEEADKKLREKGEEIEEEKEKVKDNREKTKKKVEKSEDKVEELKKDLESVEGESSEDPKELKDWVESFAEDEVQ